MLCPARWIWEVERLSDLAVKFSDVSYTWPGSERVTLALPEFTVGAGERLFVQGASGSGKSTLLSLLAGVIVPQRGTVKVLGQSLGALTHAQRDHFRAHHIGYIFQQFNLVPYLSVVENVTLPCRFSRVRCKRIGNVQDEAQRLLEHLGMGSEELRRKPVTELSVGQQQRVAAARALMGMPQLVIADEPTSALDADNREAFIELLFKECAREHASLVFVSHDAALAGLFDRTVKLADGALEDGGAA
jgi:putative ABC transport system ATP-binding protein